MSKRKCQNSRNLGDLALDACPECDLLISQGHPKIGEKAHCPRCGYLIQRPRPHSIESTLALSVAGLILMFPANLLPLVGIKILGNSQDGTLWSGVSALFNEGMWGVAILVFLASILFPLINIVLCLLISASLYFNKFYPYLPIGMRCLQHIEEWAMLEVYTLGIIVACVKLSSMAELRFGLGLYAFIALLLVSGLLTSNLDNYLFWRQIGKLKEKNDY
ncbi:MAG: paraquat-inducible protein A [Methylococcaceae bacterium]|jgi:paraquat-inducible protein A